MTTEHRPPVKAEQGCAKRTLLEPYDTLGFCMGILTSLFSLPLGLYGLHSLWSLVASVILLATGVGLVIPSRYYESGITRVTGFAISALTSGVSFAFAVFAVWTALLSSRETGMSHEFEGVACLFSTAVASWFIGCTAVMLEEIEPEPKQAVATLIAGTALGSSLVLLTYLLIFRG